nr:polyprenol reductase 2 [Tanacetum cinerariifolium]
LPIVVALLPLPGIGWFRRVLLGLAKRGKVLQSNTVVIIDDVVKWYLNLSNREGVTYHPLCIWSCMRFSSSFRLTWFNGNTCLGRTSAQDKLKEWFPTDRVYDEPQPTQAICPFSFGMPLGSSCGIHACLTCLLVDKKNHTVCPVDSSFFGFMMGICVAPSFMYAYAVCFQRFTVPQRFFSHFYVVAIFWTTMLLVAVWFYAIKSLPSLIEQDFFSAITSHLTGGSHSFSSHKSLSTREHVYNVWLSVFLLLLMEAQVLRRLYETIYVFNYSPSARMHIFGYLAGMFFYTAAPLSLCCTFAPEVFDFVKNLVAEFIVKGKDRMSRPEFNIWMFVIPFLRLRWYAWIGAAIFLWGWIHQLRCHEILVPFRMETCGESSIPH